MDWRYPPVYTGPNSITLIGLLAFIVITGIALWFAWRWAFEDGKRKTVADLRKTLDEKPPQK